MPRKKPRRADNTPAPPARKNQVRGWLKEKGHKPEKVDRMKLDTERDIIDAVIKLHGITVIEYEAGR